MKPHSETVPLARLRLDEDDVIEGLNSMMLKILER